MPRDHGSMNTLLSLMHDMTIHRLDLHAINSNETNILTLHIHSTHNCVTDHGYKVLLSYLSKKAMLSKLQLR